MAAGRGQSISVTPKPGDLCLLWFTPRTYLMCFTYKTWHLTQTGIFFFFWNPTNDLLLKLKSLQIDLLYSYDITSLVFLLKFYPHNTEHKGHTVVMYISSINKFFFRGKDTDRVMTHEFRVAQSKLMDRVLHSNTVRKRRSAFQSVSGIFFGR